MKLQLLRLLVIAICLHLMVFSSIDQSMHHLICYLNQTVGVVFLAVNQSNCRLPES